MNTWAATVAPGLAGINALDLGRAGHVVPTPWAQACGQGVEQVSHVVPGVGWRGAAQRLGTGAVHGRCGDSSAPSAGVINVIAGSPFGPEWKAISKLCPSFDIPPYSVCADVFEVLHGDFHFFSAKKVCRILTLTTNDPSPFGALKHCCNLRHRI